MFRNHKATRSSRPGWRFAGAVLAVLSLGLTVLPASASSTREASASVAGILRGVVAISADDAWAVGYTGGRSATALIEHWDGESWTVVKAKAPGDVSWLYAVAASSSSDVWAAGVYAGEGGYHGYVEHWDGATWSMSPFDAGSAWLVAISASGPDDVWAASREVIGTGGTGQTFHWDGSSWSEVATPEIGWYVGFTGVAALSPTDAWLVGFKKAGHHTIVEHWDGTAWRIVASRDPDKLESLYAIAAPDSGDLWAVGLRGAEDLPPRPNPHEWASPLAGQRNLIMHSTGRVWKPVEAPSSRVPSALLGVAAVGPAHAWSVGFSGLDYKPRAIIANWDGTDWAPAATSGLPRHKDSILYAVSASATNDAWAVGSMTAHRQTTTVIEHWDGSGWTRVS